MKNFCAEITSPSLNWNAAVGSIGALSLSRKEPAVGLHSFKFYSSQGGLV